VRGRSHGRAGLRSLPAHRCVRARTPRHITLQPPLNDQGGVRSDSPAAVGVRNTSAWYIFSRRAVHHRWPLRRDQGTAGRLPAEENAMKFMFTIYHDENVLDAMPEKEMQALVDSAIEYAEELRRMVQ